MHLVLFQPDQAANTGTMLRLAACFGASVAIIEPCGFIMNDTKLRRAGMDYLNHVNLKRYLNWGDYLGDFSQARRILLTTKATQAYHAFTFQPDDHLIVGQESSGAPAYVHDAATARVRIPMQAGFRSLNVAMSASIVLGEAYRQIGYPACS